MTARDWPRVARQWLLWQAVRAIGNTYITYGDVRNELRRRLRQRKAARA